MDDEEIGQAIHRAGKQEDPLDVSGLTVIQLAYSKAVYGHLRALAGGYRKAAKIVRLVRGENGLEVWRNLVRKLFRKALKSTRLSWNTLSRSAFGMWSNRWETPQRF